MKTYQNRVAAITGAASGIGRALAKELAARGAHLAISDVQEEALAETAAQCERLGARVTTQILDVTDRKAFDAWAASVADEFGDVHMIFNNAGIAIHGTFEEVPDEVFERVIDVEESGDALLVKRMGGRSALRIPRQSLIRYELTSNEELVVVSVDVAH